MLFLQNAEGEKLYLCCGTPLTVSRSKGNIILANDKSVSRDHATITVNHTYSAVTNPLIKPEVFVKDNGSKYGTYINENIESKNKMDANVNYKLNIDDRIKFGVYKNEWRLHHNPLITSSSAFKANETKQLVEALLILGGYLVREWTEHCHLLVMNELILTAKVPCALASCCDIVLPQYLYDLVDAVQNKKTHPIPRNYLPEVTEACIRSKDVFNKKEERRNLFKGKTFIFTSNNSMKQLGFAVQSCGGKLELLSAKNYKKCSEENYLLINPTNKKYSQSLDIYDKALDLMKENGFNEIPESDIGLAVLCVSTKKYCNPVFSMKKLLQSCSETQSQRSDEFKIYAMETESFTQNKTCAENSENIIKETVSTTKSIKSPSTSGIVSSLKSQMPTKSITMQLPSLPTIGLHEFTETGDLTEKFTYSNLESPKSNSPKKRKRNSSNESAEPKRKKSDVIQKEQMPFVEDSKPFTLTQDFVPQSFSTQKQKTDDLALFSLQSVESQVKEEKKEDVNIKRKTTDFGNNEHSTKRPHLSSDSDLFILPSALKTRRRQKVTEIEPPVENISPTCADTINGFVKETPDDLTQSDSTSLKTPLINEEHEVKPNIEQLSNYITGSMSNWAKIKEDPMKVEQKSMIVIQIESLVKTNEFISKSCNSTYANMPNFKKFRKSDNYSCSNSKIIGIEDLVMNIEINEVRNECIPSIPAGTINTTKEDEAANNAFNLPMRLKSRRG